jgi:hypothetical protein
MTGRDDNTVANRMWADARPGSTRIRNVEEDRW